MNSKYLACPKLVRAKLQSPQPQSSVVGKLYHYFSLAIFLPEQYYQQQNYENWTYQTIYIS